MTTVTPLPRAAMLLAGVSIALSSPCPAQESIGKAAAPSRVTIGRETTWFTEPVRADGTVDFIAAVNARFAAGATAETNACVLLYEALGPSPEGSRQPERFFRLLGVEPLPDQGAYFRSLHAWVTTQFPDGSVDPNVVATMQSEAMARPWRTDEFPLIAAWIEAQEVPLRAFVAATERPAYFSPLTLADDDPDGCIVNVLLPGVQASRELSRALLARAMRELADGRDEDARRDLLAIHRFGRLVGQGPTLIESLVGAATETMAIKGASRLLAETKPSNASLAAYRAQLDALPPRVAVVDKLDVAERAMHLDLVQALANGRMSVAELRDLFGDAEPGGVLEKLGGPELRRLVGWDTVLMKSNAAYDRLVEAGRMPDALERSRAVERLVGSIRQAAVDSRARLPELAPRQDGEEITQVVASELMSLLLQSSANVFTSENRVAMQMRNLDLAIALAAYRNDHDGYPESLAALTPRPFATVPIDLFSGQPVRYVRTEDGYRLWSVGPDGKEDVAGDAVTDDLVVEMPATDGG